LWVLVLILCAQLARGLGVAPSLRYAVSFMFIFAVVAVAFYQ
jgi:hypothetical protein